MKICIKENEFNPTLLYQNWCSEESAINMGYTIVEVDEQYKDVMYEDFNEDLTFSVEKYNARKQKENADIRIAELKKLLKDTDYKALKYAEGVISASEYLPIQRQRQAWRDEINELEASL